MAKRILVPLDQSPVAEILEEAEACGADLIAVTTEGRGAGHAGAAGPPRPLTGGGPRPALRPVRRDRAQHGSP
jgi:hypothetical protein